MDDRLCSLSGFISFNPAEKVVQHKTTPRRAASAGGAKAGVRSRALRTATLRRTRPSMAMIFESRDSWQADV